MAIKKSQLQRKEAPIEVEFEGDTVNLVYNSRGVNADFERALAAEGLSLPKLARALAGILISWDITEDDGVTIWPLTKENLETLGGTILDAFLSKILSDQRPNDPMPVS